MKFFSRNGRTYGYALRRISGGRIMVLLRCGDKFKICDLMILQRRYGKLPLTQMIFYFWRDAEWYM